MSFAIALLAYGATGDQCFAFAQSLTGDHLDVACLFALIFWLLFDDE